MALTQRFENCDCFDGLQTIPGSSVSMVLCDLPYGVTDNEWDTPLPLPHLWREWGRVCRPDAGIVLFSQQPHAARLVSSNYAGFSHEWIWAKEIKTGHLNAHRRPMRQHESILVFNRAAAYYPQGLKPYNKITSRSSNGRNYRTLGCTNWQAWTNYPSSILQFGADAKNARLHATQKPVALCEYLIRTYTKRGETVLDCCAGSGTTVIAALNTERGFIAFEKCPEYYTTAAQRIAAHMKTL